MYLSHGREEKYSAECPKSSLGIGKELDCPYDWSKLMPP
jgi:hypothetical protein